MFRRSRRLRHMTIGMSTVAVAIVLLVLIAPAVRATPWTTLSYSPGYSIFLGCPTQSYNLGGGALAGSYVLGPYTSNGTSTGYIVYSSTVGSSGSSLTSLNAYEAFNASGNASSYNRCWTPYNLTPASQSAYFNSSWGIASYPTLVALCTNLSGTAQVQISLTVKAYVYDASNHNYLGSSTVGGYSNSTTVHCRTTPVPGAFPVPDLTVAAWQATGNINNPITIHVGPVTLLKGVTYSFGGVATETITVTGIGWDSYGMAAYSFGVTLSSYTLACTNGC